MNRVVSGAAVLVALLLVGACSDDDDGTAPVGSEGVASSDAEAVTDVTATEDADGEPIVSFEVTNDGSCSVTVTGDKEVSYEGGGTVADVLMSYWLTDAETELLGDDFTFLFNCSGPSGDSLSIFNSVGGTAETIPQAPGAYPLTGGLAGDGLFSALVTIADSETNWGVTDEGGTIDITRFDDERITGTFTIPMEDTLAELSGAESEGEILVEGAFDFPNPNA